MLSKKLQDKWYRLDVRMMGLDCKDNDIMFQGVAYSKDPDYINGFIDGIVCDFQEDKRPGEKLFCYVNVSDDYQDRPGRLRTRKWVYDKSLSRIIK